MELLLEVGSRIWFHCTLNREAPVEHFLSFLGYLCIPPAPRHPSALLLLPPPFFSLQNLSIFCLILGILLTSTPKVLIRATFSHGSPLLMNELSYQLLRGSVFLHILHKIG